MNRIFAGLSREECVLRMKQHPLSVGILAASWIKLGQYLSELESLELPLLHLDLMDGRFCPQFTVGPWAVSQLPSHMIKDVHLMVEEPWPVVVECVKAGAHCVTVQVEGNRHLHHILHWLGQQQAAVQGGVMPVLRGISLCPATPLEVILPVLNEVEMIQVLAVNPGYGSKVAETDLLNRLEQLAQLLASRGKTQDVIVAVDGSLTLDQLTGLKASGVERVVSGSALFKGDRFYDTTQHWLSVLRTAPQ
ncbi:epimerase [Citrobacter sp. Marseille-Q6884]|uniref:epimerase n=1 Tax=Citrobacter sp. Marseille-Q6884 TaxID=2956786 RepID=UPI0021B465F5|nr:epimerase [Citrobacter sp. Marseille-Q6884]